MLVFELEMIIPSGIVLAWKRNTNLGSQTPVVGFSIDYTIDLMFVKKVQRHLDEKIDCVYDLNKNLEAYYTGGAMISNQRADKILRSCTVPFSFDTD